MKFLWTTIFVKDLDESIAFYTEMAGLTVQRRFPAGPKMELAFLGNNTAEETLVELIADADRTAPSHSDSVSLGFAVDSVDKMVERVTAKRIPLNSAVVETPGARFFSIKDPNGVVVQFFQQKG